MKKTVLLLALVLSLMLIVSCATTSNVDIEDYVKIIEVKDASADDLFVKANTWMVDVFNNSESVIEYSDKQAGVIKGKFDTQVGDYWSGMRRVSAVITIETKDEKARISVVYGGNKMLLSGKWLDSGSLPDNIYEKYQAMVEGLGLSLELALKSQTAEW